MFPTSAHSCPPETKRCPGKTSERLVEIPGQAREHDALFRYPQRADGERVLKGLKNKHAASVLSDVALGRLLTTWAVKPRHCSADS